MIVITIVVTDTNDITYIYHPGNLTQTVEILEKTVEFAKQDLMKEKASGSPVVQANSSQ